MNFLNDIDWEDIIYHNLGAIAIGLIAAFTQWPFIFVNAIWFINELIQRSQKKQSFFDVFIRKQVLWEWVSPTITGVVVLLIVRGIT